MTSEQVFKIFEYGIDYGLFLAELERESEETFDAFQGVIIDNKYVMPAQPSPRRQIHSEKWFSAKRKTYQAFLRIYLNKVKEELTTNNLQPL